jgi:hypothetical protein
MDGICNETVKIRFQNRFLTNRFKVYNKIIRQLGRAEYNSPG